MKRTSFFAVAVIGCGLWAAPAPCGAAIAPQLIEDLVNIRFQVDARIYAVMTAINVAGFDLDADRLQANPTRAFVRGKMLPAVDTELRTRLRDFYVQKASGEDKIKIQGDFISFALHLSGPPRFTLAALPADLPPDIQAFVGFELLVQELWQQGALPQLWEQVRDRYTQQIEAYRPLLRSMIIRTLGYLHTDARVALDRRVIFIPDFLGSFGSVNARNVDSSYIIVVGPSLTSDKLILGIRHEYLHFLMDPLLLKYRSHAPEAEPFMKRVKEQPRLKALYAQDFDLMLAESLLRAMELRLDSATAEQQQATLIELYDQGLILAPYFWENLKKFELSNEALQDFFPKLIEGLSWNAEARRSAAVDAIRSRIAANQAEARKAAESQDQRRVQTKDLLQKANTLLQNREWSKAKEILQTVLAGEAKNPNALFGLAQIALQEDEHDRALSLYEQASASADRETWIVAWSHVQRGKIYAIQGDGERARTEWTKVLDLPGDLRGAAEAARKALGRRD